MSPSNDKDFAAMNHLPFTLEQARVGDSLLVTNIPSEETATLAMRLGIAEGELVELAAKVPGGPLVIRRGGMEIALGRDLCRGIQVEKAGKA